MSNLLSKLFKTVSVKEGNKKVQLYDKKGYKVYPTSDPEDNDAVILIARIARGYDKQYQSVCSLKDIQNNSNYCFIQADTPEYPIIPTTPEKTAYPDFYHYEYTKNIAADWFDIGRGNFWELYFTREDILNNIHRNKKFYLKVITETEDAGIPWAIKGIYTIPLHSIQETKDTEDVILTFKMDYPFNVNSFVYREGDFDNIPNIKYGSDYTDNNDIEFIFTIDTYGEGPSSPEEDSYVPHVSFNLTGTSSSELAIMKLDTTMYWKSRLIEAMENEISNLSKKIDNLEGKINKISTSSTATSTTSK